MATTRTGKLSELTPDHSNANRGTERGRYALEASLRKYGAGRSILIDRNGRIIAGNKTAETAADVGIDDVIVVQTDGRQVVAVQRTDLDLDSNEARELAYADNRVGQLDLDFDPAQILADLNAGVNLDQFWRKDELDELLADLQPKTTGDTPAETDRAEELRQKWGTCAGQLWSLDSGNGHGHRLICGDCTDASTVARVMGGERASLVATSPPYWVGKEYERESGFEEIKRHIAKSAASIVSAVDVVSHIAINTGATTETAQGGKRRVVRLLLDWWQDAFEPLGFYMRNVRIWAKQGGWTPYSPAQDVVDLNWEFLASFVSDKILPQNKLGESWALEGTWIIQPQTASVDHSAPFPVEIPSRYITLYTNEKGVIYEPYCGSGTTIIACENLGRKCRAVEISATYVAVALERWSTHTGKTPVLVDI